LKKKYDAALEVTIKEGGPVNGVHPHIVGISTFDHTVFNALYVAQTIRHLSKPTAIIMGGDYWDFDNARRFVENHEACCQSHNHLATYPHSIVDGIVVGYGERVLEQLIERISAGERNVSQMDIVGLVNLRALSQEGPRKSIFPTKKELSEERAGGSRTLQTFNIPNEYLMGAGELPFTMVRLDPNDTDTVRILTQRGCSYGACQFCTQIDKHLFFEFPVSEVLLQLKRLFDKIPSYMRVKIRVDNDEISPSMLIGLIGFLKEYDNRFDIFLSQLQVKRVNADIVTALVKAGNASKYFFALNWESINPRTLQVMGKGHNPLDVIASSKAILDSGAKFISNYLYWFPRQNRENRKEELRFILATRHLGWKRLNIVSYQANRRDSIFRRAEELGIVIERNPYDTWLKDCFGVDLEYSYWMYDWRTRLRVAPTTWINRLFERIVKKFDYKIFPLYFLFAGGFAVLTGNRVYLTIGRIFLFIKRLSPLNPENDARKKTESTENVFVIKDNILLRHSSGPMKLPDLRVKLTEEQIIALRAAYWPICESELACLGNGNTTQQKIAVALQSLEKLGAIIRYENKLVSIVNDPDGLRTSSALRETGE
jgi:hypothetical protein